MTHSTLMITILAHIIFPLAYRWNSNNSKSQPGTPVSRSHCYISYTDWFLFLYLSMSKKTHNVFVYNRIHLNPFFINLPIYEHIHMVLIFKRKITNRMKLPLLDTRLAQNSLSSLFPYLSFWCHNTHLASTLFSFADFFLLQRISLVG